MQLLQKLSVVTCIFLQILVSLLGSSNTAQAFSLVALSNSKTPLDSMSEKNFADLLDQSVGLFSQVQRQQNNVEDPIQSDIQELRKRQITALVEDVVLSQTDPAALVVAESPHSQYSVTELSQLLDQTILVENLESFSQDQQDEWVQQIQILQLALEEKMQTSSTPPAPRLPPSQSDYRERLEQIKTLVLTSRQPSLFLAATPVKDDKRHTPPELPGTKIHPGTKPFYASKQDVVSENS